jgi:hypothetical protein
MTAPAPMQPAKQEPVMSDDESIQRSIERVNRMRPFVKTAEEFAPLRQPDIFERALSLTTEVLLLADNYNEAAARLEVGRVARSINEMQAAFADIQKFTKQASQLNEFLRRAIEHHNGSGI